MCRRTPGACLETVILFSLLHDCQRLSDGHDADHGRRAAALVRELAGLAVIHVPRARLARLAAACAGHADGAVSDDPTVGTCWDADRLNLWRVGVEPAVRLLSTEAARSPEMLAWARIVHQDPPSWAEMRGS